MKKLIAGALAVALLPACAVAQTTPGLVYGQVPTAAQWNSYFAIKQDLPAYPPCPVIGCSLSGPLITAASVPAAAGVNIPPGTAPTTPNNGDLWLTSSGLFARFNGTSGQLVNANIADQTVSGGANVTSLNLGTVSSGTTTIDCGARPLQYLTDGGSFTLAAPSNDGSCIVLVTNNGSAGTISFSGFTVGANTGDVLTTTNTSKFSISIWRVNGTAGYRVAAHQ